MYNNILIPTDGSEQANNAVEAGLEMAQQMGATVHALYVITAFEAKIVPITKEQDQARAEHREYGEKVTGSVADLAGEMGVECVTAIEDGLVYREIKRYVEDNDIDLIVMGSQGQNNLEDIVLGSTTDKVIRTLDTPVTVVFEPPEKFGPGIDD
jgi:nucleotide-binding universal stress UspA family protein